VNDEDGTVAGKDGTVAGKDGTVAGKDGTVAGKDGSAADGGTVAEEDGALADEGGFVAEESGMVPDPAAAIDASATIDISDASRVKRRKRLPQVSPESTSLKVPRRSQRLHPAVEESGADAVRATRARTRSHAGAALFDVSEATVARPVTASRKAVGPVDELRNGDIRALGNKGSETAMTGGLEAELPRVLEAELPRVLEAELPRVLEAELSGVLEAELPGDLEATQAGVAPSDISDSEEELGLLHEVAPGPRRLSDLDIGK